MRTLLLTSEHPPNAVQTALYWMRLERTGSIPQLRFLSLIYTKPV